MKTVNPQERKRIYHYPDGSSFAITDVVAVRFSENGGHRINTKDGKKYIPAKGWIAIEFDMDEWSF